MYSTLLLALCIHLCSYVQKLAPSKQVPKDTTDLTCLDSRVRLISNMMQAVSLGIKTGCLGCRYSKLQAFYVVSF